MSFLEAVFVTVSVPVFALGLVKLVLLPLAVLFELRPPVAPALSRRVPRVSVVVPAYNEEVTLAGCIDSVLTCGYPDLELVLVDDGSTDATLGIMDRYLDRPGVVVVAKENGGKGSALNAGIAVATGEVLLFVDADGLFTPRTVPELVAGFRHPGVGAVCGNDQPVNLDRTLTRLLAVLTHVGTGLTRRALALIGCLPIVAGNSGAFRADVVREVGGFREDTVGEDLELTWRVQFAGYDVEFAPRADVLAEVPSTLRGLWRQRVRWGRGLIQTSRVHRRRLLAPQPTPFGLYLPINVAAMLVVPVLQVVALVLLPVVLTLGLGPEDAAVWPVLAWLGLPLGIAMAVVAVLLDRAYRDLKYLYVLPLWVPYSVMMSVVAMRALWLEATGAAAAWNKLDRTGVVSVDVVSR